MQMPVAQKICCLAVVDLGHLRLIFVNDATCAVVKDVAIAGVCMQPRGVGGTPANIEETPQADRKSIAHFPRTVLERVT